MQPNENSEYESWGVEPPSHVDHEFDRTKLVQAKATKWWMVGNRLHATTDMGELVQTLPTNVICKGTDKNGLPILEKI